MGRKTKQKQEEFEANEARIEQWLAKGKDGGKKRRGKVTAADIMPYEMLELAQRHKVRDCASWVYGGKSKDPQTQLRALARHTFCTYPVPAFLENAFLAQFKPLSAGRRRIENRSKWNDWYFAVAQGKSLYKTCSRGLLTKKETHYFLQAPDDIDARAAIWYARAWAYSGDRGVAYRIATSAVGNCQLDSKFYMDIARFCAIHDIGINEIQETLDFCNAMFDDNPNWTINKRTLASVRRLSDQWHRDMIKLANISGGNWSGFGIGDWSCTTGKLDNDPNKNTARKWFVVELTTGRSLGEEGRAQRHCVSSYKRRCEAGDISIVSLRSTDDMFATKGRKRHVTMEVTNDGRIVQIRGLANRDARPQELEVIGRWAHDCGLQISRW